MGTGRAEYAPAGTTVGSRGEMPRIEAGQAHCMPYWTLAGQGAVAIEAGTHERSLEEGPQSCRQSAK